MPKAKASLNAETGEVVFECEGTRLESVDCFLDDRIIGVVMVCGGYWCLWEEIGTRGEGGRLETDFQLPSPGEKVAAYVFALSADGSSASDSVCVLPPTVWEKGE